jgi:hypothetical protein
LDSKGLSTKNINWKKKLSKDQSMDAENIDEMTFAHTSSVIHNGHKAIHQSMWLMANQFTKNEIVRYYMEIDDHVQIFLRNKRIYAQQSNEGTESFDKSRIIGRWS